MFNSNGLKTPAVSKTIRVGGGGSALTDRHNWDLVMIESD